MPQLLQVAGAVPALISSAVLAALLCFILQERRLVWQRM
jgi:hypothetical protein